MKKALVLVSLFLLASLSIARAESPNVSTDQVNKQDSFLLAQNNDRDTRLTDLLINKFNPPIAAGYCGAACETDSHCSNLKSCSNCVHGTCCP